MARECGAAVNSALTERGAGSREHRPSRARRLRVLHCLWTGEIGGAERAVYQLVREQIRDSSLEPAILFAQGRGHYWSAANSLGCPVIDLALWHGHALREVRQIATRMRDFDVHHFHSAEPIVMLSSILCGGATRVYTHRGGFTRYSVPKRLRYELTGMLVRRYFHAFSGNTLHGARAGARLYRLASERFDVTYNGLAFELLAPLRPADAIRAELGITPADFVLGTAANLKSWKRVDRLVDLVSLLRDPALRLLVVGDGPERSALEAQARSFGAQSNVIFVGAQPHPPDYLQIMDAFCLPSMGLES
jgi:glycosyltransferase involved in cell wall biosynthesis